MVKQLLENKNLSSDLLSYKIVVRFDKSMLDQILRYRDLMLVEKDVDFNVSESIRSLVMRGLNQQEAFLHDS